MIYITKETQPSVRSAAHGVKWACWFSRDPPMKLNNKKSLFKIMTKSYFSESIKFKNLFAMLLKVSKSKKEVK